MEIGRAEHLLPESVAEIVAVIGLEATADLVAAIGGCRFKFGRGVRDTPRLRLLFSVIGEAKTYDLLRVYGGEELYLPRCDKALRALRNERFLAEYLDLTEKQGLSGAMAISRLCPRYKISDRTAYTILRSKTDPVTQQRTLF